MATPQTIDGHRVLGVLGRGGNGRVFQVQNAQGLVCALKLYHGGEEFTAADEKRFKKEWEYGASLEHPNIVTVFGFGMAEDKPYFTMEFVEGGHLRDFIAAHGGPGTDWVTDATKREAFVTLIGGILSGLSYIHARRIVHRDLKPENILIAGATTAKIMDFGLARNLEASIRLTTENTLLGTVAYMSPEQVMSAEVDPRSDLYSLGIILFEWLHGRLPYDGNDFGTILAQIVGATAPMSHVVDAAIPEVVSNLISCLLEKDSHDRPATADEALGRFLSCFEATTESAKIPRMAVEPLPDLFEPVFVGRETEMERLLGHLAALQKGKSALAFISGEPGVGKTRLAGELGYAGGLRGVQTVQGRCYEEVDVPFQAFVPVLRAALKQQLNGALMQYLKDARPLLRTVLPELGARDSAPRLVSPTEERAEKFRIFEAVTRTVQLMATLRPLLLILDDVQWADPRSLELVAFLARNLLFVPDSGIRGVFLVALYRDEAMPPDHPLGRVLTSLTSLPGVEQIKLPRLDEEASSRMVASMLGGRPMPSGLADLLTHESDGNALFISEFLKALLQDNLLKMQGGTWQLESQAFRWSPGVDSMGLPIPITVRDVVRRRLQKVSPLGAEILGVAAILGREFRYELLRHASGKSDEEVLSTVEELIQGRLLVEIPHREVVAFNHPQIREVVLEDLSVARRRLLHQRAGEALEQLGSAADLSPYLYDLARHFTAASIPHRAARYLLLAADQAYVAHAYEKALENLKQVLSLVEQGAELAPRDVLGAQEMLAQCHFLNGEYRPALQLFTAIETQFEGLDRARILRRMGRAFDALGEHDSARSCYQLALNALGEKAIQARGWAARFKKIAKLRRLELVAAELSQQPRLAELRRLYDLMMQQYYFVSVPNRDGWGLELMWRHLDAALQLGRPREAAQAWLAAGFMLLQRTTSALPAALENPVGVRAEGRECLNKALSLARSLNDTLRARILREVGYCFFTFGDIRGAMPLLEESSAISTRLNDALGMVPGHLILANARYIEGNLAACQDLAERALSRALATENATFVVLSRLRLMRLALLQNRMDDAVRLLSQASQAVRPGWDQKVLPMVRLQAMQGELLAAQKRYDAALPRLESAREACRQGAASLYDRVQINFGAGMAMLDYVEAGGPRKALLASAESVAREIRGLVFDSFPKAESLLVDGRLQAALGQIDVARRRFARALELVAPLSCPLQLARCLVEAGRTLGVEAWLAEGTALARQHGYTALLLRADRT